MPNHSKIYSDAIHGSLSPDGVLSSPSQIAQPPQPFVKEQDAARTSVLINWLASTPTKEMLEKLNSEVNNNINRAIALASQYHRNNDHQEIILLLVRANELRYVIKQYGNIS